jgi:hypothetical protein
MKKPPAGGGGAAPITIAALGRGLTIIVVPCGSVIAAVQPFNANLDGLQAFKHISLPGPVVLRIPLPVPVVVAYLAVVALTSAWLLYRGCRLGARFDDHGVTVRKLLRTDRYSWPEVSHFADGHARGGGDAVWALDIVLNDGRAVTVTPLIWGKSPRRKTMATIEQAAERYSVPAELTGTARARDGLPASPGLHPNLGGKPGMRHWDGSEWSPLLQAGPARGGAGWGKPGSGGAEAGKPPEVWAPLAGSKQQWHDAAFKARHAEIAFAVVLPMSVITLAGSWVLFVWGDNHGNNFNLSTPAFIVGLLELIFAGSAWSVCKEQRKIDQAGRAAVGLAGTADGIVRPAGDPAAGAVAGTPADYQRTVATEPAPGPVQARCVECGAKTAGTAQFCACCGAPAITQPTGAVDPAAVDPAPDKLGESAEAVLALAGATGSLPAQARVRQRYLLACLIACLSVCLALFIVGVIVFNRAPANSGLSHTMARIIGLSLAGESLSLLLFFRAGPW